jgi:hypothetical protein
MQAEDVLNRNLEAPSAEQIELRSPELIAYRVTNWPPMRLVPARRSRPWMDGSQQRFAYRCLPLLIANQAGWWVLNSHPIRAVWSGGWDKTCVRIQSLDGETTFPASGHFGEGVLTFNLPYLFRTPPGYNLYVHGPANLPKDSIQPLEGIVETDWTMATFTMNWKFTRPNVPIVFERDEPICMVTPMRRGMLESFEPRIRDVRENPELEQGFAEWSKARTGFLAASQKPQTPEYKEGWQKHYFRGIHIEGDSAPEHQSKLTLKPFEDRGPSIYPPLPQVKQHPECLDILAALGAGTSDVQQVMQHITYYAFPYTHIYATAAHGRIIGKLMCRALFPKVAREMPLDDLARQWEALRHEPFDGLAAEAAIASFADACAEESADPNVKAGRRILWEQRLQKVLLPPTDADEEM